MTNENLENNTLNTIRKPLKFFKDKRKYDRLRDRKDKKLYEAELIEVNENAEGDM
jgi:hypothetical protein